MGFTGGEPSQHRPGSVPAGVASASSVPTPGTGGDRTAATTVRHVSDGEAAASEEPAEGVTPADAAELRRRPAVDPGAVLLAVDRLAADVAALGRALAAQPEELAARLDVDAATAAIGVRVGALGAALDQLRLSLLAALDRAADRMDAPTWLPDLQGALGDLRRALPAAEVLGAGAAVADALDELGERFEGVIDVLAGVARRQDQVSAAVASVVDQVRGPRTIDAVFDRMEQRERSIAARLDRIDAGLRQRGSAGAGSSAGVPDPEQRLVDLLSRIEEREQALAARLDRIDLDLRRLGAGASAVRARAGAGEGPDDGAAGSLATSVEAIATITEGLARLVESTAERLDRRLARVEADLAAATSPEPDTARTAAVTEDAALRLARLRAERAQVQARLQEERLLAGRTWKDEE